MTGVLYISYTGMLEPLGQSQVLAYLERLATDRPIHLVSFEEAENWADSTKRMALSKRILAAGLVWHPLRYHKRPSAAATAYDIAVGAFVGARLVRRHGLRIVHARSYVPSVMALAIKRLTGAHYLFDMRGFWADERVDGGLWPKDGRLYRIAKGFERRFLLAADAVVSLTNAAKQEIATFPYLIDHAPPVTVIPTCADLNRFYPGPRTSARPFTLGYVGGAGTWYLFEEALALFRALKRHRPDARLLIANRNEHAFIRAHIAKAGIAVDDIELVAADHSEIPELMWRMDAGLVLIKPVPSKIASAPTKLAEFLGCGVPCVVNPGVGDMESIVADGRAGIVIRGFSDADCRDAVHALLDLVAEPDVASRCVETARRHFALDAGVRSYMDLYDELSIQVARDDDARPDTAQKSKLAEAD
ncbi:glycosyltransferase [Mesorhizobium sp. M0954]|uniref:glycosyltransferase n=1 Tax=Mesorhizobium sp. M0954 TaxID=2957032 RepID=UPI003335489F